MAMAAATAVDRRFDEKIGGAEMRATPPFCTPNSIRLARLERFELPTHGLEVRCSIQLSYRREAGLRVFVFFIVTVLVTVCDSR